MTAPSPRGPARRATASTIAVAAVVVGLLVGAAGCAKEKLSPAEARRARKMGHLTVTGATPEAARATALQAAAILGIAPF